MSLNERELAIEVINQYLAGAKGMIDGKNGVFGYAATLLLLCVSDAIGHSCLPTDKHSTTKLDVFTTSLFDNCLNHDQATNLKEWFRTPLAHTGCLVPRVYLFDGSGQPFVFDSAQSLRGIRVRPLHDLVQAAWAKVDKPSFRPGSVRASPPGLTANIPSGIFGPTASGML